MKNEIAERIRILRLSKNLSQQNMADELDITVGAYSNIERGKAEVTITRLYKIADVLNVPVTDLLLTGSIFENSPESYGYATKTDIENIKNMLRQELAMIKQDILLIKNQKPPAKSGKKK